MATKPAPPRGYPWQRRQTRRARMQRKRREAEATRRARVRYLRRFTLGQLPPHSWRGRSRVFGSMYQRFHLYPGASEEISVPVPEDGILLTIAVQAAFGSVQAVSFALPGVQRMGPAGEWTVIRPDYAPIPLNTMVGDPQGVPSLPYLHRFPILEGDRIRVMVTCTSPEEARYLQVALTYIPAPPRET